jgi:hypothetical protein
MTEQEIRARVFRDRVVRDAVECHVCGAARGARCVDPDGRKLPEIHGRRFGTYRKAKQCRERTS